MLAFTIPDTSKLWLLTFLLLWAAMLFGGFFFGEPNDDKTHRTPTWARLSSSFALVVAAWVWWLIADYTDLDRLALFIAIGMTLGFVGDLFMARLFIKDENYVLAGIAAFGFGHIAYITGLLHFGNENGLDEPIIRWITLVAAWIIGVVLWDIVVYRRTNPRTKLHLAALPYALLLATTAGIATGLALQEPEFTLLAVGAILFLLSDLLLATQLFNNLHFPMIGDVVWLLYGPGQMLIVFAVPIQSIL